MYFPEGDVTEHAILSMVSMIEEGGKHSTGTKAFLNAGYGNTHASTYLFKAWTNYMNHNVDEFSQEDNWDREKQELGRITIMIQDFVTKLTMSDSVWDINYKAFKNPGAFMNALKILKRESKK